MLDDLEESAKWAARDSMRGQGVFFDSFLRRFKERLMFNLIFAIVTVGIVIVVFLYIFFVVVRHL